MSRIVIVGGGFAGISALARLRRLDREVDITLIDKGVDSGFLPMLPDVIGRRARPEYLCYGLKKVCSRLNCGFVNEEVRGIDLKRKSVFAARSVFSYDYLLIACGSQTNFYGNEKIRKYAYRLDSVSDAEKILAGIGRNDFDTFIVGGAGYTGIEVASNLRRYLNKNNKAGKVVIVERAQDMLGPLPAWMKDYVRKNLKSLDIEVYTGSTVDDVSENSVILSNAKVFENSMLIWSAGVKIPEAASNLGLKKSGQGRLFVDDYLRLSESCFAAGDAACFSYGESFLRMAVQFSIAQGNVAACNIARSIAGRPLVKYKPRDLGYIVPMANNKSCGIVLGLRLKGRLATAMHYLMCIYRSYGLKNKAGIFLNLIAGGGS